MTEQFSNKLKFTLRVLALPMALAALYPCAARAQSADAVLCDRLAASSNDPDRPADVKGVIAIPEGDIATAIKFCKQASAAPRANRRLSYELGRAYEANRQPTEAIAAYRKAANGGSTLAIARLGALLPKDEANTAQTKKMFERAAEAGDPAALTNQGMTYATGDGVPVDYVKARALFGQAAAANYAEAQFQLGAMTEQGDGGPKDDAAARVLYEKAAAQDHVGALERAGAFAQAGRGGPSNAAAATAYYEKAAALGSQDAKDALQRMKCRYSIKSKSGSKVTDLCF